LDAVGREWVGHIRRAFGWIPALYSLIRREWGERIVKSLIGRT